MASDWVVLELGPKADGEDPDLVRQSIRHMIRDAEVFIPAMVTKVGGERVVQYLLEGYAFIRRDHPDEKYYRLEGSKYVQAIITNTDRSKYRAVRRIASVPEADVTKLRKQIEVQGDQGIGVGDTVLILSGPYRQIHAQVIEDIPEKDQVQVHVKFRSKEALLTFPRAGLRLVSKVEKKPETISAGTRASLRRWLDMALPLSRWTSVGYELLKDKSEAVQQFDEWLYYGGDFTEDMLEVGPLDVSPVNEHWGHLHRLSKWIDVGQRGVSFLKAMGTKTEAETLRSLGVQVERLTGWSSRWDRMMAFVRAFNAAPSFSKVETHYMEWSWLQDVHERMEALVLQLEGVENELEMETDMPKNIIIDGNNLAVRCGKAPGLDTLKDSKGRPSGVVTGFLRSITSFQKRWPDATIYVVWDGSSQRRKGLFSGYKAGRTPFDGYEQILWLKELLPSMGVEQAWNETEEADDVIATLVEHRLSGAQNLIISSDRDLLQLVTETTHVLVPSIAGRPEKLFDPAAVSAEYNVPPSRMTVLRAMLGDNSDKIPGIPRFPEKVVSHLVSMYGSLDGIFSANLPELTSAQQGKVREFEGQVRKNLVLMTLVRDLAYTVLDTKRDKKSVEEKLQDVDVKPDAILGVFFPG